MSLGLGGLYYILLCRAEDIMCRAEVAMGGPCREWEAMQEDVDKVRLGEERRRSVNIKEAE